MVRTISQPVVRFNQKVRRWCI